MSGRHYYFIEADGNGDPTIWRDKGPDRDPVAVFTWTPDMDEAFDLAARGLVHRDA